jgi:membrane protein
VALAEGSPTPDPKRSTRRERLRSRVDSARERVEAARSTSPTVGFAFDALSYDTDTGASVLAAALGFRVFLFQVPYVCTFVLLAGYVSEWTGRDPSRLFRGKGVGSLTAQSVNAATTLSGWTRITALFLALYALYLGARAFVKVLYIVHALVWQVPRIKPSRPSRAALVLIAIVTASALITGLVDKLRYAIPLGLVVSIVLYTLVPLLTWWLVSWWLPHRKCPPIALLPGAVVLAVGGMALQIVTVVWFPHHLQSKSEVYGTLGISIALLLWAYLLGRLMTLGTVLNVALWARFGDASEHPLEVTRPHLPVVDAVFGRVWSWAFGARAADDEAEGS